MTTYRATVRLDDIQPSPTNPRKHFNEAELAELAASIREHGLITAVLLRTNPTSNPDAPHYELISGERRWRAAKLAGLETLPADVRDDLSPAAIIEIQLIENLQRQDLHPLEEAEGYGRMMREHGYTADHLAEKIGKSRSYIFGRLKLLDLSDEARRLFYGGLLTPSTALLVARIPTHKLQAKALEEITKRDYNNELPSVRTAARLIQNRYMLRLDGAPFPTDDGELIATAGPCGACPKRTGNAPELFDDVEDANVCTDPDCFALKKMAMAERRLQQVGKDIPVITGAEAEKIMPQWKAESATHVKLDDHCYDDPQHRTYREILGDDTNGVAMVEHGQRGELVEVVSKKAVASKLKEAGVTTRKDKEKEDARKLQAKVDLANHWRDKLFRKVREKAAKEVAQSGIGVVKQHALPIIALRFLTEIGFARGGKVCGLWGAVGTDDYARFDAFKFGLPNLTLEQQFLFLLDLALVAEHRTDQYNYEKDPGNLIQMARALEIDPEALFIEAKKEQKAAEAAKKPKKTAKKSKPVPSEGAFTPTEAAQAQDSSRDGGADATEAAPAGGVTALEEQENSAAGAANEEPTEARRVYHVGDVVRVKEDACSEDGWALSARGKVGRVIDIDTDPDWYIVSFTDDGGGEVLAGDHLIWIAGKTPVETNEKPTQGNRPPVKYQHPENADLQWSGRGRKPKWVEHCLADGRTLTDLEISA